MLLVVMGLRRILSTVMTGSEDDTVRSQVGGFIGGLLTANRR